MIYAVNKKGYEFIESYDLLFDSCEGKFKIDLINVDGQ